MRFLSSPGAIFTSPLSPAVDESTPGIYLAWTEMYTSILLERLLSGSVTVMVKVPELLGSALLDSLTTIVVEALKVGITFETLTSLGIISQTLS